MLFTDPIFWLMSVSVWTTGLFLLRALKKTQEQKSQKQLKRVPIRVKTRR